MSSVVDPVTSRWRKGAAGALAMACAATAVALTLMLAVPQPGFGASYVVKACDSSGKNKLFVPRWDNSGDFVVPADCDANGRLKITPPLSSRPYQTGAGLIATHPKAAQRIGDGGWGKILSLKAIWDASNGTAGYQAGLLNDGDSSGQLTWVLGPGNKGNVTIPDSCSGNWRDVGGPGGCGSQKWTWGVSLFAFCAQLNCGSSGGAVAAMQNIEVTVSDDEGPGIETADSFGPVERGTPLNVALKATDLISGARQVKAVNSKGLTLGETLNQCDPYSWVPCPENDSSGVALDTSKLSAGENVVRLRATDYAGNTSERPVQVTVTEPSQPTPPVLAEAVRSKINVKLRYRYRIVKGKKTTRWYRVVRIPDPLLAARIRSRNAAARITPTITCTPAANQAACRIRGVSTEKASRLRSAATILTLGKVPAATSLRLTLSQPGRASTIWDKASPLDD